MTTHTLNDTIQMLERELSEANHAAKLAADHAEKIKYALDLIRGLIGGTRTVDGATTTAIARAINNTGATTKTRTTPQDTRPLITRTNGGHGKIGAAILNVVASFKPSETFGYAEILARMPFNIKRQTLASALRSLIVANQIVRVRKGMTPQFRQR